MQSVWTKSIIGALTASALAAAAFASPADARGLDFGHGGHGGHAGHFSGGSHATLFRGGGFRGRGYAGGGTPLWGSNHNAYYGNGYNNGYGYNYGPALGLGAFGLAAGALLAAPTALADESCVVRRPIWSHGRIVGHRWVDVC